jgi:hypothetical protein
MEPSGRCQVARPFAGFRQQPHRSFAPTRSRQSYGRRTRRPGGDRRTPAFWDWRRATTLALGFRSPPCVCGRDLIEVTHGITAAASKGCSGSQSLEASSSVAQLETKIAQREEALRQRQLIGVATGLLPRRSSISREREGNARCRQRRR